MEKCILCQECEEECPEDALEIIEENGARIVNINSQHFLVQAAVAV